MLSQLVCSVLIIQFSSMGCPCGCLFTSVPSSLIGCTYFYSLFPFKIKGKTVDFLHGISIKDLSDSAWIWEIWSFLFALFLCVSGYFMSSLYPEGKQCPPWPPELIPSGLPSHEITQLWSFFRAQTTWFHLSANPQISLVTCLLW